MAFVKVNPNPSGSYVGDCVVRAISIALDKPWHNTYTDLCIQGLMLSDMPSSNKVWGRYLELHGFHRHIIPDTCPYCYTVKDFAKDYPQGTYVLGTGTHVITIINGDYYDSWDSGDETPVYYWRKGG